MSFYHSLLNDGKDTSEQSEKLLRTIGLSIRSVPRFRDAGINKEQNYIWVLARIGGANRLDYHTGVLTQHPLYIKDHDEKFDKTYAIYYFQASPQEDYSSFEHQEIPDLKKKTDEVMANIQSGNTSKETEDFIQGIFAMINDTIGDKKG